MRKFVKILFALSLVLTGLFVAPMSAFADSDTNCFVRVITPLPNNPERKVTVYLPVPCDDRYKAVLGMDIDPTKCYLAGGGGASLTMACLNVRQKSEETMSSEGEFAQGGGNPSGLITIWNALTVNPPAAPPATPVAAPITGTTPPATAPSTGSGATTTAEQVTFPEGTLDPYKAPVNNGEYYCGSNPQSEVKLAIDLGCKGKDPAILDLMFAIIRLLSIGVGIVVVGSVIFAGIQYTASRGNPQEVAAAQERIRSAIIALLLFIFTYAILNWIVPAGVLK